MTTPCAMPADAPRFLVDRMLLKLGTYLRLLGYDAAWDPGLSTRALVARAAADGRLLLTGNRRLADQHPSARRALVVAETDPVRQLRQVVAACRLDPRAGLFSRCVRCNVPLEPVPDPAAIRARVPPRVFARHEVFFACPACRRVFWRGSHVRNTLRKLAAAVSPP